MIALSFGTLVTSTWSVNQKEADESRTHAIVLLTPLAARRNELWQQMQSLLDKQRQLDPERTDFRLADQLFRS